MEVTIINATQDAAKLLIYTKETRLGFGRATRAKIDAMTQEEIADQLAYIANTIPSSWEFVDYTFEILGVTRAFTHQFVRTRTGTYAQQTMRLLNMEDFEYMTGPTIANDKARSAVYDRIMKGIQDGYNELQEMGAAAEDSRGALPTNIHTNIIAKFNLRTLSDLARSRTGGRTQGEYQEVVNKMLAQVITLHPWTEQFLFKPVSSDIKGLEDFLQRLANDDQISTAQKLEALKYIDQIKRKL